MAGSPPNFDIPYTIGAHIDARAAHPATERSVLIRHDDRTLTYARFRDEAVRRAHFLLGRLGVIDDARPGHVAIMLENHPEFLELYAGCAFGGLTLFGINTGLGGETLAGVLNQSRARVLITGEAYLPRLEAIHSELKHLAPENVLVYRGTDPGAGANDLAACLSNEVGPAGASLDTPGVDVAPDRNLLVIYTSGTTGLPKGIINNHFKLLAAGLGISQSLELTHEDVGYLCMPLFHSNSMFLGFHPAFWVGGSVGLRERFSASRFVPDVLHYGTSYWNYVGEPVHYVLAALEREYGGDEARILAEVAGDPRNRLRFAIGNGATPPDIDRFSAWLGLEDMYELYGSTEAAISTWRRRGDPRGSVGELTDESVKILDEQGAECPPAQLDADGKILNYAEAVGEICKISGAGLFQGYFENPEANAAKLRGGIYHSGDLGHVLVRDGRRFLYFDGRTDDWIRKDGENFSAAQVAWLVAEQSDVALAAAYGVPCAVSDELVMVALKLQPGRRFDPQGTFDFYTAQVEGGALDRKWFPDFVRIVDDFEYTPTQKIVVRPLKQAHFDRRHLPDAEIYWRRRGDTTFHSFTREDYEALRAEFEAAERVQLLDR